MEEEKAYYVYMTTNYAKRPIYTGMTNDLMRRIYEHKNGIKAVFTKQYHCHRLVYYEQTPDVYSAIEREKQIKKWRREKKIFLIEKMNPEWRDLYEDIMDNL